MLDENGRRTVATIMQRLRAISGASWPRPTLEEALAEELSTLLDQRDTAWGELREIREMIHADPNEATPDEVRRFLCPGAGRAKLYEGYPEHPRTSTDEDVETVFASFWLPMLMEDMGDGEHMEIPLAVKRELYDYSILLEHVPKVYMEVTGGMVSKPNTTASAVIGEYEENVNKLCAQAVEDFKEEMGIGEVEAPEWLTASALLEDLSSMIPAQFHEAHKGFEILEPICKQTDAWRAENRARVGIVDAKPEPVGAKRQTFQEMLKSFAVPGMGYLIPESCEAGLLEAARLEREELANDRDYKVVDDAKDNHARYRSPIAGAVQTNVGSVYFYQDEDPMAVLRQANIEAAAIMMEMKNPSPWLRDRMVQASPSHTMPQPTPTGDGAVVMDALLKDLEERRAMGVKKYGTPLRTFNGRNALVDLYQELLDGALYAKQRLMEEESRAGGAK